MSEQTTINKTAFELKVSQPNELRTLFGLTSEFVQELTIQINHDGLFLRVMDPSHVCLIDLIMPNSIFEKYEVFQDGSFAVRPDEIYKIFKTFDKKESVSLKLDSEILEISTKSSSLKIRTLEISSYDTPLPRLTYNAQIGIEIKSLKNALKRIREATKEYVKFVTTNNTFQVIGKLDDNLSMVNFEKGMIELKEIDIKEDINESTYSLEYIDPFLKHISAITGAVKIEYSSKMPLRIESSLNNIGKIWFYLAPRVEN